jgi:hypothetical protein
MATLQDHRDRIKQRNIAHNQSLARLNSLKQGGKAWKKQNDQHSALDDQHEVEEKIQKGEMLSDPALIPFVCDLEFSFLHRRKYEDNHEVEALLCREFPQGVGDSEWSEGHFYVSRQFKEAVKFFLRSKADSISIHRTIGLVITEPEGEREYLARETAQMYHI